MTHLAAPAAALSGATVGAFADDQAGGRIEGEGKGPIPIAERTVPPIANATSVRRREQGAPSNQAGLPDLDAAREETWRLLQSAAHYCRCAQLHLEAADDAVTLYDMRAAREYFVAAIRQFEPLRRSLAERIGETEAVA